ncbi:MAG: GAF domain-containing protein [Anaerolineae bacterium]|nr:GAF domain-containing protein [Anaerolineae bacterium]
MQHDYLERINQTLRATKRINQAILYIRRNRRGLLQEVCKVLAQECGYEAVWIGELRNGELYPALSAAGPSAHDDQLDTQIAQAPYNLAVAKQAFSEGKTVIGEKTETHPRHGSLVWTTAAVPIRVNEAIDAILTASTTAKNAFDDSELRLLKEIAADVSFALESMKAESRRAEAEEALRTSEERFRRLSEHALVGIVLIQGNLIRYINPAAMQMFGYESPAEVIDNLRPRDLTAPDYQTEVEENIEACLQGEMQAVRFTFKGMRKDGGIFDVETYGSFATHARRPAIIASVMDVTAREVSRQQLEALSEAGLALSRARTPREAIQLAVEKTSSIVPGDAVNIFLVKDQYLEMVATTSHRRLDANLGATLKNGMLPETQTTYGYMATNHCPLLIVDTASSSLWRQAEGAGNVRAYVGTPLIVRDEVIGFLNVDGSRVGQFTAADARHLQLFGDYVAATIEHLRLIESLETERQRLTTLNALSQTLAETLELKEVARRALAHIKSALDIQQGMIHLWDKDTHTLTAISEQGIAQPVRTGHGLSAEYTEQTLMRWVASQREAENGFILDLPLKIRDELIGILSLSGTEDTLLKEEDQQLLRTLSVPIALALQNARFYEATAHQAQVLKEALRRQEELDRMKDEMLQNISHELRTPIALVMGYAEMLRDGAFGSIPEQQVEAIDIVARRSVMLRDLVENFTVLWQIENPEGEKPLAESVDLTHLASSVCVEFQNEAHKKTLTLYAEALETPLCVHGIQLQFRRLLDNLISNALKFTPSGGHIRVRVERQDHEVVLSVCDDGIGVPPDQLERIFERFYQVDGSAKRRYGGVGLGLALVRSVVAAHGGTVHAKSPYTDDPEKPGLCVVVRLPLSDDSRT